jgi:hypothetical protein
MITMAALLPQRHSAQTMVDQGGDDGMLVKEYQPQLRAATALVLMRSPVGDRPATAPTVARGHGRIEQRHSTTRAGCVGSSEGPELAQVLALGCHVIGQKTGKERVEVV